MDSLIFFISDSIILLGIIIFLITSFTKHSFKNPDNTVSWLIGILSCAFAGLIIPNALSSLHSAHLINIQMPGQIIPPISLLFKFLILTSALLWAILSRPFIKRLNQKTSRFAGLSLLCVLGGYGICYAASLISLFLSVETVSLALCLMIICFDNPKDKAGLNLEAAIKYFILNGTASLIMLFGISCINAFPATGEINIAEILFFTGLMFKIGAFPFYMWVMDIFKGTSFPVGFFAAVPLQAVSICAIVKSALYLGSFGSILSFAIILCSIVTLIFGSLLALRIVKKESKIKDFLGAFTMLNMGYALFCISFFTKETISCGILYFITYLITAVSLFGSFGLVIRNIRKDKISRGFDYESLAALRGLSRISPFFALLIGLSLLSFAGFPPFTGFSLKFCIFLSTLKTGIWALYPLLFTAFASIVSAYFCFKLLTLIYSKPDTLKMYKKKIVFNNANVYTIILSFGVILLVLGFFLIDPVIEIIKGAI